MFQTYEIHCFSHSPSLKLEKVLFSVERQFRTKFGKKTETFAKARLTARIKSRTFRNRESTGRLAPAL